MPSSKGHDSWQKIIIKKKKTDKERKIQEGRKDADVI